MGSARWRSSAAQGKPNRLSGDGSNASWSRVWTAFCTMPPGPAGRKTAIGTGDRRTDRGDDPRRPIRRGDPLDRTDDGQGGRDQPPQRAADLGSARLETASDPDVQAVEGPTVRRQGTGYRRVLPDPAGARAGAIG